ncbi:UNVERIFIED_CONTAM: Calcium-dependent protein kinase [Sesamum radiatum]|uniref:non-specific serine/threonine protein kinase n=1 Tax=Sesamum radiatum TaxID=300843 RepID=A0AAW2URT6_SESRA
MGNCCAAPAGSSDVKKKRGKTNPFAIENGPNPASGGSNKLVVLKDPTGHNINARYDLGRELGRGEFGVTYLCTDVETGEKLACKSISKKKLRTAVDIEDVRREVEIMKHMPKHPSIVTLKDTYEDDSAVHIVMELCEGGELFDRIVARGHYTERAAAHVMRTIVEVIQADVDGDGSLNYGEFVVVSVHLRKMANDEHLHRAFAFFDKDGSGFIEIDELRDALNDEDNANTEEVINAIMQDVDTDKDGRISYDEFLTMMKAGTDWRKASRQYSRERFNSLSLKLIRDGSLQLASEGR